MRNYTGRLIRLDDVADELRQLVADAKPKGFLIEPADLIRIANEIDIRGAHAHAIPPDVAVDGLAPATTKVIAAGPSYPRSTMYVYHKQPGAAREIPDEISFYGQMYARVDAKPCKSPVTPTPKPTVMWVEYDDKNGQRQDSVFTTDADSEYLDNETVVAYRLKGRIVAVFKVSAIRSVRTIDA